MATQFTSASQVFRALAVRAARRDAKNVTESVTLKEDGAKLSVKLTGITSEDSLESTLELCDQQRDGEAKASRSYELFAAKHGQAAKNLTGKELRIQVLALHLDCETASKEFESLLREEEEEKEEIRSDLESERMADSAPEVKRGRKPAKKTPEAGSPGEPAVN